MYIVIMAGGSGTRFWPRSRATLPKQMLNLFGEKTMLQLTYNRVKDFVPNERILVITNRELREGVINQLPDIPVANIIAEPFGRNTAPCIALAAAIIKKRAGDDETMIVLPADHLIKENDKFIECMQAAAEYAPEKGCLITVGIKPFYPETGYGYIQEDDQVAEKFNRPIYKVKTFAEKPDVEIALRFIKSGDFLWNSGMFIWTVSAITKAIEEFQPELADNFNSIIPKLDSPKMDNAVYDVYSKIKPVSIDYGVMEMATQVCVIEADFTWNDVGSWEAVYNLSVKDYENNAIEASSNVMLDSKNNYIFSSKKIVAAVGIENLVVVDTNDALLICKKDESQKVKELVEIIK
ncbi:MAG TPA: mannose-1-phosphate guanylyltransferase, partial [Caldithrix sp.]|nr:mannose-1-phosphate guanylyltransferase [Caldithrix sp.]